MVATRSRTPVALTSLAGNQFMKAYRIMTPFWARGEGEGEEKRKKRRGEREGYCRAQARRVIRRGGVAFAVQPHREVRPESGLVGIVEHIVVNKR